MEEMIKAYKKWGEDYPKPREKTEDEMRDERTRVKPTLEPWLGNNVDIYA
jgi:hypothetical protein